MRSISAIIPVYNSEATLSKVVERLLSVLSSLTAEYEIILVDDCSRDSLMGGGAKPGRATSTGARHPHDAQFWSTQRPALRHPGGPL